MLSDSKKISIRQAMFLFLTIIFTPSIRIIPVFAAEKAKQAAWLTPSITVVILLLIALIWQAFYKKYKDCSLLDIYSDIAGSFIGKILAVIQLVWIVMLTGLYVRYFDIRMVGSIYPNMNMNVFGILLLVVIAYTLRSGFSTLARFNEIFLPMLAIVFYILVILMLPNVKIGFLMPISYRSIIPIFTGSTAGMGILAYFTFIFILGDKINNKEKIKKAGVTSCVFLLFALTAIVAITLGSFTYSVVQRVQLPFLVAVKQIALFNTLERIESVVVALWVLSDFVLISFFTLCALNILKFLFKLTEIKPFINIYMVLTFVLSNFIAKSVFEMDNLSRYILIPGNILLGLFLPAIILVVGKIRRKV